jgi:dolichol-phosphate mannosyltransferase
MATLVGTAKTTTTMPGSPDVAVPDVAVVVPTFNEAGNVAAVVRAVEQALADFRWELIFVDDASPDGTADKVREIAKTDSRVRCIERYGRRGLSGACIEGLLSSSAPTATK